MPRRRSIKIFCLTAAVLVGGGIAYFATHRQPAEPSFQGRSASYWLHAIFGSLGKQQLQGLEAFRQMGANADPVLVAAIEGRETLMAQMLRRVYPKLPAAIRRRLPQPDDLGQLRAAASLVLLNTQSDHTVAKLLPWLATPDSELRRAVLYTVMNRIGPRDAGQVPLILLAANDPDGWVKIDAGRALWKVTGHSNAAISALEGVLRQNQDAGLRLWAARYLLDMGQADPLLTITFINSLTNGDIGMRMSACSCLGQIGRPAAAAIPSLRQALQDRDPEVRRRAKSALTSIDPEHP